MSFLQLTVCLVLLNVIVLGEILNYDNKDCIIDSTKDAKEDGNYVDCNTAEMIAANKTRCCDVEGAKGCCTNQTKGGQMIAIGSTIAVVTAATMTGCFVVFWCNPDTIPCLKKCPCRCCNRQNDEFGEMTDMSDEIKKTGEINAAYGGRKHAYDFDEYAPAERYDMPDELKAPVQDEWWSGHNNRDAAF